MGIVYSRLLLPVFECASDKANIIPAKHSGPHKQKLFPWLPLSHLLCNDEHEWFHSLNVIATLQYNALVTLYGKNWYWYPLKINVIERVQERQIDVPVTKLGV